jgi:hypothetical protein
MRCWLRRMGEINQLNRALNGLETVRRGVPFARLWTTAPLGARKPPHVPSLPSFLAHRFRAKKWRSQIQASHAAAPLPPPSLMLIHLRRYIYLYRQPGRRSSHQQE